MISHSELLRRYHYDPDTGVITLKPRPEKDAQWNNRWAGVTAHGSVNIDGESIRSHRFAWFYMTGSMPAELIDHIDGNNTNHKWNNLREATKAQNNWNKKLQHNNVVGHRGVNKTKWGTYAARIERNGKKVSKTFKTLQEAIDYRDQLEASYFGEFQRK